MERKTESRILITGSTGMIGGLLVRKILEEKQFDRLVLPVRSLARAESRYRALEDQDYGRLEFVESRIEDLTSEQIPMSIDSVIHCACVTQSSEMITCPVETADSIVVGTRRILEFAREKQIRSMVYLSSMEVYGNVEDKGQPVREEQLGDVDLMAVRSCYPMAKRMAEHYCYIYHREYGLPVKIARLAQTFGRGVQISDRRVYMQFARAVQEQRDIVLHTKGLSMGNYCATDDAVEGILTLLYKGENGEAYNVVNEANTMRIRDMADLVACQVAEGRLQVRVEAECPARHSYAPDTGLRLSDEKLRGLGWRPKKGLMEMYKEVLEELTSRNGRFS